MPASGDPLKPDVRRQHQMSATPDPFPTPISITHDPGASNHGSVNTLCHMKYCLLHSARWAEGLCRCDEGSTCQDSFVMYFDTICMFVSKFNGV